MFFCLFFVLFFSDLLYKSICIGYSSELHQQVNAILMGTHNIYVYKEVDKSTCYGYSFELHQQVDAVQMGTHNICLYKEVDKKVHWL